MHVLLDTLQPVAILATIFSVPIFITAAMVFHSLRKKELEVRRLEALANLASAVRRPELPAWLDHADAETLAEWTEARREVDRLAVQPVAEDRPEVEAPAVGSATAQHALP